MTDQIETPEWIRYPLSDLKSHIGEALGEYAKEGHTWEEFCERACHYGHLIATVYLLNQNYEEYSKFLSFFKGLKIREMEPFASVLAGCEQYVSASLENYFENFQGGQFRNQFVMGEYVQNSADYLEIGLIPEFKTKYGSCDYLVQGPKPFLLELKIAEVRRKDIHQVIDYVDGCDGKYPGVILGFGISDDAVSLAERNKISVYSYTIHQKAPTIAYFHHRQGKKIVEMEDLGELGPNVFLSKTYDQYARLLNWPLAPYGAQKEDSS